MPAASPMTASPSMNGRTALTIESPDGAKVTVNGSDVGTGRVVVEVPADQRAVVKVLCAGFLPWSSVVEMGGRARLRVKPQLKPRA